MDISSARKNMRFDGGRSHKNQERRFASQRPVRPKENYEHQN
jgi:hypothetical protein